VFENLRDDQPQSLDSVLARARDLSDADWIALVWADQRRRWRNGESVFLEAYLEPKPELVAQPEKVFDLIWNEVALREEIGEVLQIDEYVRRFPEQRDLLERQFALHQALVSRQAAQTTEIVPAVGSQNPDQSAETIDQRGTGDPWKTKLSDGERTSQDVSELHNYDILAELGRGGMGVVYKARHKHLNRLVALKMILSGPHAGAETLGRFRREAEAIAQLQHPNLVQIYDVGEQEGRPFFSLEFMEGGNLDERIAGRPQPAMQAAQIVETLARAMHAVHQRGIIHRDLKPANVLLTADGTVKIGDFGLAKKLGEGGSTVTGDIVGTPSYMAPEQAAGKIKDVGAQTDVYALGAILYALLTGRPPFTAETAWDVVAQVIAHEPVPPRRLQPTVPGDLETICLKCLQKDARRRYASAVELAEDLHRFQTNEPIKARPASALTRLVKWARRHPARATLLGVSALAIFAFIAIGVVYNARLQSALDDAQAKGEDSFRRTVRLHVANGSRLADDADWFGALVWYTQALSMEEERPDQVAMHRVRVGTFFRQCPRLEQLFYHPRGLRCVEFSPDGRYLVVTGRGAGVWIYDLQSATPGESVRTFEPDRVVFAAAFDGPRRRLATATADGRVQVWDADRATVIFAPLQSGAAARRLSFSHDGRFLLAAGGGNQASLWKVGGGIKPAQSFEHAATVNDASFAPDDRILATAGADKTVRVWRVEDGRPVTEPLQHPAAVTQAAFSRDGGTLATVCLDHKVRLWEAGTWKLLFTLDHGDTVNEASFSRDSRWLVTACTDGAARIWNVATGRQRGEALRHFSEVNRASFSQDGSHVATAGDDNTARLWDVATQQLLPPLLPHHGTVECAAFSPDGKWLVTASKDQLLRLWAVQPERLRPISERAIAAPRDTDIPDWRKPVGLLSPDGLFTIKSVDLNSIRVWDVNTGEPVGPELKHNSDIYSVSFSPDGRRVLSASDDNTARVWDPVTGELASPPLKHQASVNWAAFSRDGKKVVTASTDRSARVWDMATGDPLSPPLAHPCEVRQAAFTSDGLWVVTTGADNIERRWDLRPDDRPIAELVQLAQVLAGSHIDPARGFLPLGPENVWQKWQAMQHGKK